MDGNTEKINMSATSTTQLSSCKKECDQKTGKWDVFKQMQDAKLESDNSAKYANKVGKIFMSALVITIMMPSIAGLPTAMLINGAIFLDRCPVEPYIPIYMLVAGSVFLFKIILDYSVRVKKQCQKRGLMEEETPLEKVLGSISSLTGLFLFGWFIAGNVWVFRVYAPSTDPTAATYCHHTIYWFAFGVIIAGYACAALGIFLCCCCACCAASYAAKKMSEQGPDNS